MNFELDCLVDKQIPSTLDFIYFSFWDRGISLEEFNRLPIPYILTMIQTLNYIKAKEQNELEKTKRKR